MTVDFQVESDKIPVIGTVTRKLAIGLRELLALAIFTILVIICIVLAVLLSQAKANQGGGGAPVTSAQKGGDGRGGDGGDGGHVTPKPFSSSLCVDKLCLDSVSYVLSNLKKNTSPCSNFYQYACGQYEDIHSVDPNQISSVLVDVMQKNIQRIEKILLMETKQNVKSTSEQKVKDYYRSCVDDFTTEGLRGGPFIRKVLPKIGGSYFLKTWNEKMFSFSNSIQTVQSDLGVSAFWKFQVQMDVNNNYRDKIVEIWPTGISRHVSVYHYLGFYGAQVIRDYKKFMRRVANLFVRDSGITIEATEKDSLIEQFINDTWSIEYQIVQFAATLPPTEKPYENENRLSLGELNTLTNNVVNWVSLAKYMYKGYAVSESTKVVVHHKTFLKAITAHIQKLLDNNNHRVIHNYLTWRTMETYVQDLSWDYVHANREMYVDINGQPNFLGKKKYCFSSVLTQMPDAVGALFVANHFADKNKDKVTDITNAIKNEVLLLLEKTPWMDASTRKKAKEKLAATQYNIGYPALYRNQQKLDNVYADLQVKKTDYFGNVLALVAFKRKITTSELEKGENMDRWYFEVFDTALATVFYLNKVVLPAGLLQFPVYDYHLPHYMTFGSIGTFIGRFLLHLVDVQGSHWNSNNYYMGADKTWWTQQTKQAYTGVKNCLVDMYNQTQGPYKSPTGSLVNRPINSTLYAYQALATASGVRIAYAAYQKWTLTHTELIAPNNLHLSNKKMFFLSFAQTWCTHRGSLNLYHLAMEGTPTEEIKVNFALKGLTEFTQVFNCPPGSAMNPSKKCQLF